MPQMGRPSSLNSDRQDAIIEALGVGSTRKDAAAYSGISYACLKRWVTLGRRVAERIADRIEATGGELDGELSVLDEPDWPYFQLVVAMEESEARANVRAHATIAKAIHDDHDWKAAAWYLRYARERRGLDGTTEDGTSEEALRAEGFAIVEELRRREASREADVDQGAA